MSILNVVVLSPFSNWQLCSREAKTRIRHRDWLKFTGEKIQRKQVGTVPTFLSCVNKVENALKGDSPLEEEGDSPLEEANL